MMTPCMHASKGDQRMLQSKAFMPNMQAHVRPSGGGWVLKLKDSTNSLTASPAGWV